MKRPLFAFAFLALLIGSFLGGTLYNQRGAVKNQDVRRERRILHYVDPMNPAHTSDKPGVAPCGMPMEPVYEDSEPGAGGSHPLSAGTVKITPQKQQMIGVLIGTVENASETHSVRTLGRVVPDEGQVYRLVAGSEGRMGDVYGSTTGSLVKKDQLMARFYVKDFSLKQRQFLAFPDLPVASAQPPPPQPHPADHSAMDQPGVDHSAMDHSGVEQPGVEQPGTDQSEAIQPGGEQSEEDQRGPAQIRAEEQLRAAQLRGQLRQTLYPSFAEQKEIARLDLLSLGVGEAQLREIARTMKPADSIEISSPVTGIVLARNVSSNQNLDKGFEFFRIADLSRVWIMADVFSAEAPYIRAGMKARISLPQQGRCMEATVSDVPPQFDAATRTLKVRLEMDNPELALRPDMFVDVEFLVVLPPAVAVPEDAVLDSGLKQTVYLDVGNGFFEPREVKTGWRFGGRVEIIEGLMPGDRIAVSGNFLIDSERQMRLASAGLYGSPVKDPVCGMDVYTGKAKPAGLTADFEGKTYYFCSEQCKEQFEKAHKPGAAAPPESAVRPGPSQSPEAKAASETARDPVCGMTVRTSKATVAGLSSQSRGKVHYFCSRQCKDQFDKAARRYSERAAGDEARQDAPKPGEHKHD